jgi:hypothetical protein
MEFFIILAGNLLYTPLTPKICKIFKVPTSSTEQGDQNAKEPTSSTEQGDQNAEEPTSRTEQEDQCAEEEDAGASREPIEHQEDDKMWTRETVLYLLEKIEVLDKQFETGVKKNVWSKIAQDCSRHFNKPFTSKQVEGKWKGLKRT